MSRRATIYISDPVSAVIGVTDNLSSRIGCALVRYHMMCDALMPCFTRDEWCAIFAANSGTDFDASMVSPTMVWANVADLRGPDGTWGVAKFALVEQLRELSVEELLAVQEACVRYWMSEDNEDAALIAAVGESRIK